MNVLWWVSDPMVILLTSAPYLNGGHDYGFTSSVGHPRLDSVGLIIYDDTRIYPGYQCCITSPSGQRQPCREWVNILGIPYEMTYMYTKYILAWFPPTLNYRYCHRDYASKNIQNKPWPFNESIVTEAIHFCKVIMFMIP
jgi:hypothetical protein